MSDLSEVFCIIDTREQNKARINAVTEFIESHGGAVEHSKLDLCDYKIEGIFREKEICLGIEAKSLSDFSGSYQDLPDKLSRSFELYNDVALFVEIPQIRISSSDGFHATIINQSVPDGSADVLQYAVLQNSLASWQSEGVHVRQLQNEAFWGYAIASVLISITKDTHRGLEITKVKDFKSQYLNILSKFDGIGQKTALKVIKNFPNLYWLCTYSEDDLKDAIGKVTGSKLYQFIHNNDLITSEWANKGSKTQLSKETEKSLKSNPEQSLEVKNPELAYLDNHNTKCIEVPKGKYQNGGQLFDINSERDQDIETLQSSSTEIEVNAVREPLTTSKVSTPDTLPEAPEQSEFKANPRLKDVVEFIRRHPRKTEDVGKEFGLSPEYNLKVLYALWHEHKKIWFEKSTCTWNFGCDKNPVPVVAEKELDIGV